MDAQGRITFNPELRRELNLEGQELHLFAYRGRVEVLNEALYLERKQSAMAQAAEDQEVLEMAGLR
jgi:DNA-binding transcriptional regulator/RsmH inhibitor MraZ